MNFGTSEAQSDRYDSDYKKVSLIIVKCLGWRAEKTEDLTLWDLSGAFIPIQHLPT